MDMIAIFNFRLMLKSEGLVKRNVRGLGTLLKIGGECQNKKGGVGGELQKN